MLAATDRDGNTALMHAAAAGRLATAELLAAGANVAAQRAGLVGARLRGDQQRNRTLRTAAEKGATASPSAIATASAPGTARQRHDLYAGWPDRRRGRPRQCHFAAEPAQRRRGSERCHSRWYCRCFTAATLAGNPAAVETLLGAQPLRADRRGRLFRTAQRRAGRAMLAHGAAADGRRDPSRSPQRRADMRGSRGCCSRRMRMLTRATRAAGAR